MNTIFSIVEKQRISWIAKQSKNYALIK